MIVRAHHTVILLLAVMLAAFWPTGAGAHFATTSTDSAALRTALRLKEEAFTRKTVSWPDTRITLENRAFGAEPAICSFDANGNITALMDGNQNIVARYEYDGFGKLIGKWGALADANVYRFSSKEIHPNSGLYYYGFRFYEPNLQRWLNRDPIGEAGGINLYGFVGNSPLNRVDPFGLDYGAVIPQANGSYVNIWDPGHPIGPFPPPTNPVAAARDAVSAIDYTIYNPIDSSPQWWGFKTRCNEFVGDCISKCPNRPRPLVSNGHGGKRYPTANEWADPNISIPGYGPPHNNPQPGDVVTEGGHVGFMDTDGYVEAPTYRPVTVLPFNNPIWNPGTGRTPTP